MKKALGRDKRGSSDRGYTDNFCLTLERTDSSMFSTLHGNLRDRHETVNND